MRLDDRRALGNRAFRIGPLRLGTMYFGTRPDDAASFRLLDAWADAGGFFIDTANKLAFWQDGWAWRQAWGRDWPVAEPARRGR